MEKVKHTWEESGAREEDREKSGFKKKTACRSALHLSLPHSPGTKLNDGINRQNQNQLQV